MATPFCVHILLQIVILQFIIILLRRLPHQISVTSKRHIFITGVVIAVMGVIVGSSGFLFALTRSRRLVLIIQLCSEGIHAVG